MQKVLHQGHFVQLLGLSMVKCDDKEVMEFNFGRTSARFTEQDFALMIGLKFSTRPYENNVNLAIQKIITTKIQT